jgi:hypothetical protein
VSKNAGIFGLGIRFVLSKNVSVDATYHGQFAKDATDQGRRDVAQCSLLSKCGRHGIAAGAPTDEEMFKRSRSVDRLFFMSWIKRIEVAFGRNSTCSRCMDLPEACN